MIGGSVQKFVALSKKNSQAHFSRKMYQQKISIRMNAQT